MNAKQVKGFLATRLPLGTKFDARETVSGHIEAVILPDSATNITLRAVSYSEEFPALMRQVAVAAIYPNSAELQSYHNVAGEVERHRLALAPEDWDQVASSLAADLTWVVPTRALYTFQFALPLPVFATAHGNSVWANTYAEAIAAAKRAFPRIPADPTSFVRQEATDENVTQSTNGLTGDKQ